MYDVQQAEYGLRLSIEGFITEDEMEGYCKAIREAADDQTGSFGVLADMRETTAMPDESEEELKRAMGYCDRNGLERAAGIIESATTAIQLQQMAEDVNHAGGNTVFIDASELEDWESTALEWVKEGIEPAKTW
jgi:hypothetical protein